MLPGRIRPGQRIDGYQNHEFSPKVYLVDLDDNVLFLQSFMHSYDSDHPLSKAWAYRIAEATGLPLIIQFDDSSGPPLAGETQTLS